MIISKDFGGILMKIRKLSLYIITILMIFVLAAAPVSAAELPEDQNANVLEAAAILREGLKNREMITSVSFTLDADSFDGTAESAKELAMQVMELSYAHNGVPDEGDYLRWSLWYIEPTATNFVKLADGWQFNFSYYAVYFSTVQQEAELDTEIAALVEQLGLKNDMSDYEKITTIYDYICSNITYDYDHRDDLAYGLQWTAYAAVVNKTAVCQGYATLLYRLALEAGMDCRIITGMSINPEGQPERHAWNMVKVDNLYYYLDSTWDAETYAYNFFLKSAAGMINHDTDPEFMTEEYLAPYSVSIENYAHADVSTREADYEYQIYDGQVAILRYNGIDRDVVVPATLGGYPVKWIGSCAFMNNPYIVSLTFSEGIEIMESQAITECFNLKSIHLPSTIDFTASKDPLFKCNVTCGAFHCPAVETVTVAEGNPNITVFDNVIYNKEMTILRYYPAGDPRSYFDIPEGVLSVSANAFNSSKNLKEIKMSDTVQVLQMSAFEDCTNLEKVHISNSCKRIDQFVFSNTALESVHLPASVENLFAGSFSMGSKIKTFTVDPNNPYYYVVDGVLYGHYKEGVNTDDCHQSGDWLVKYPVGTDATSFTVPEGIIGIEQHAFDGVTDLQEVILPGSLRNIYSGAFLGCSGLARIDLPEGLTHIYDSAFNECKSLVELVIPSSVTYVGGSIVWLCDLESLVFLGDAPEMYGTAFNYQNITIHYPAGNPTWDEIVYLYSGNEGVTWYDSCGNAYQSSETHKGVQWIPACKTHQFTEVSRPAGCITGYTGLKCSVCGLLEVTEILPGTGHTLVVYNTFDPFCDGPGGINYRCQTCGNPHYLTEIVGVALGHDFADDGFCIRCCVSLESFKDGNPLYRCSFCQNLLNQGSQYYFNVTDGIGEITCLECVNKMQNTDNTQVPSQSPAVQNQFGSGGGLTAQTATLIFVGVTAAFFAIFGLISLVISLSQKKKQHKNEENS